MLDFGKATSYLKVEKIINTKKCDFRENLENARASAFA